MEAMQSNFLNIEVHTFSYPYNTCAIAFPKTKVLSNCCEANKIYMLVSSV